ncbi:DNA glycosylase, partial [Cutaneotrichosporon oleaginosum]
MASPAENLRSRLAQYAYAGAGASPSPRRSPRTTAPPTATTSGYVSDDEDSGPSTPSKPAAISPRTPKRRPDGSLDKFGWKKARGYASPEKYAHLQPIGDCLAPELKLIFCGINPGTRSSKRGHHFAHPTNKFWRALHLSGLTPRLLSPEEDSTLPSAYRYGLTNLVDRPTAEQNELSPAEMRAAVLPLVRKFRAYRPRVVCFVGKKIWD